MDSPLNLDHKFDEIIQDYTARLTTTKPGEANEEWIKSQCVLARLYIARSDPDSAIACCKAALGFCSKQQYPMLWAEVNYLAGAAYIELTGDSFFNLGLAITYLENALEIYTEKDHLKEWIETTDKIRKAQRLLEEVRREEKMESVWGPIKAQIDEKLCFVMMPFIDPDVAGVYEQIIKPVVLCNGLTPKRADSFMESRSVMHDVWQSITTARVLIADLTNFNDNVYYELGLCHALNKKPILMTQNQEVPFDLKPFRIMFYSNKLEKLENERQKLDEFIKEALRK